MGFRLALLFLFTVNANAALTLHIQNPFRNDSGKSEYMLHILGGAAANYNPEYGESSRTLMKTEGNNWFSYTWDKSISDFADWQEFTIKACPNTSDNNYNTNNCVAWNDSAGKTLSFKMQMLFATDSEIWFYTDAKGSYKKSFVPPGSKLVWFKSPWGNKALPRMIFGADSVLMRFAYDDSASCGWFYGAISPSALSANPLKNAYFERFHASYLTFPKDGVVWICRRL